MRLLFNTIIEACCMDSTQGGGHEANIGSLCLEEQCQRFDIENLDHFCPCFMAHEFKPSWISCTILHRRFRKNVHVTREKLSLQHVPASCPATCVLVCFNLTSSKVQETDVNAVLINLVLGPLPMSAVDQAGPVTKIRWHVKHSSPGSHDVTTRCFRKIAASWHHFCLVRVPSSEVSEFQSQKSTRLG